MIDRIDVVYVENETKLSCSMRIGAACDKKKTRQWCDQSIGLIYAKTEIELSRPI